MSTKTQAESTSRPATFTIPELEQYKTALAEYARFSTLTAKL
jgi:hypothetical protein